MIPRFVFVDLEAREMLLQHLELAKSHVDTGKRHIADQKRLIDKLDRDEHDTSTARELLRALESTQAMHLAHRTRLERRLAAIDAE